MHVPGGLVAFTHIIFARVQNDFVQLDKTIEVCCSIQLRWQFGEIMPILASADFVKDFAQAVNVGRGAAGPFRRNESLGADVRAGFIDVGHQPNVSELWHTANEDDV